MGRPHATLPRPPTMPPSRRSPESVTDGQAGWEETVTAESSRFLSADDFEGTGILAGVDPCASNYWWIPELQTHPGPTIDAGDVRPPAVRGAAEGAVTHQAARRPSSRSSTAAA